MPRYVSVGDVPRKRHSRGAWHEELVGEEGFSGASSLLYHRFAPTALLAIEAVEGSERPPLVPNHPLAPRHLQPVKLGEGGDPVTGRRVLLGNRHVTVGWWAGGAGTSPLHRDAVGDELVYVQSGSATVQTAFGSLEVTEGDHVVVPAGTVHRWVVHGPTQLLAVEAAGGRVDVPAKHRTAQGQLLEGAPYSERDQRLPVGPLLASDLGEDDGATEVLVRTRAGLTRHVLAHHPFDVVGWDGCAYPWSFQISDFEPITGRFHQPPPVHQTFSGPRFVVCAFVPRLLDTDPDAVPIPYAHANVDSDEVLFYSQGDFLSRKGSGIGQASITLHPAGFTHGPQPGSLEASLGQTRTDEVAVMLDTFDPLSVAPDGLSVDDADYWKSWARDPMTGEL
jgi:homogentisate 1,2-dioxygenase